MNKSVMILALSWLFSWKAAAQSTNVNELPPLNELGTGLFMGEMGGLYPNGSNTMPAGFYADALEAAASVQPLNEMGLPDTGGKIGLVAIGASTVAMFGKALGNQIHQIPGIDPALVYVNGGIGGQDLNKIRDPMARYWLEVDNRVKLAGLTNNQVQVVWMQEDDLKNTVSSFPERPRMLVDEFIYATQQLKIRYPNLRLLYFTGRHTTEYMPADAKVKHKEPRAYLNGWATKWVIEEQISGNPQLSYKGSDIKAPVLLWGPYFWTQGEKSRQDGYTFTRDMVSGDGVHPNAYGEEKVATDIIQFWMKDAVSAAWLLNANATAADLPFIPTLTLMVQQKPIEQIAVSSLKGNVRVMLLVQEEVMYHKQFSAEVELVDMGKLNEGSYTYLIMDEGNFLKKGQFVIDANGELSAALNESANLEEKKQGEGKPGKAKNEVGPDQPAWFINGSNKLPKLIRLLGGDVWAKAVFTTPDGKVVLEVEDVLHKHTRVNDILDPGSYYLKFYDKEGNQYQIDREMPEFLTIR